MRFSRNLTAALALLILPRFATARQTAPGASDADIVCWGPTSFEDCVDKSGNIIPTTDSAQTLGTSALRWSNIYGVNFFGNGSALTGVVATVSNTFPSSFTVVGSSFSVGGSVAGGPGFQIVYGTVTTSGSMTATAFTGNGAGLSNIPSTASIAGLYMPLTGGTFSGQVTNQSTQTIQGSAFSVGGSSFTVSGGSAAVAYQLTAGSFVGVGTGVTGVAATSAVNIANGSGNAIVYQQSANNTNFVSAGSGVLHEISNGTPFFDNSPALSSMTLTFGLTAATGTFTIGMTAASGTITGSAFSVGGASFTVSGGSATVAYQLTAGSFVGVSGATESVNAAMTGVGTVASPLGVNSSSGTLQGNTFNLANRLVKLDGAGALPAVSGANLINLPAQVVYSTQVIGAPPLTKLYSYGTGGLAPRGICTTGTQVWVTFPASNSVEIMSSTGAILTTLAVPNSPYGCAFNPTNQTMYISENSSSCLVGINVQTLAVTTIPVGGYQPKYITYDPYLNSIYVENDSSSTISIINSTNTLSVNFNPAQFGATGFVSSGDGYVWYGNSSGNVVRVSSTQNTTTITCPNNACNQLGTFAGGSVWFPDSPGVYGIVSISSGLVATFYQSGPNNNYQIKKAVYDGSNLVGIGGPVAGQLIDIYGNLSTYTYTTALNNTQTDCVFGPLNAAWCAENSGNVVNVFATSGYQNGNALANPVSFAMQAQGIATNGNFGRYLATASTGGSGALVTATCASGYYASGGGCSCAGGVAITGDVNQPNCTTQGCVPTGWTCQEPGGTGGSCTPYAICGREH